MILATLFVTVPFVVRELVPVLRELGEEQRAGGLHAGGRALADFLERDAALDPLGRGLRRDADGRPLARRIRRGPGRLGQPDRQHPDRDALHPRRHRELSHRGGLCRQPGAGRVVVRLAGGNGCDPQTTGRTTRESGHEPDLDAGSNAMPARPHERRPAGHVPGAGSRQHEDTHSQGDSRGHRRAQSLEAVRDISGGGRRLVRRSRRPARGLAGALRARARARSCGSSPGWRRPRRARSS